MTDQKSVQASLSHCVGDSGLGLRPGRGRARLWAPVLSAVLAIALAPCVSAQNNPATPLKATVDARTGDYAISSRLPDWQFRGSVGSPLQNVVRAVGRDAVGPFHSVRFDWNWHGIPVSGQIKTYDVRLIARFQLTYHSATSHPQLDFPNFTSLPVDHHVFSYREYMFAPPQFSAGDYGTPWLLFDDRLDAAIISPAGDFQAAVLSGDGQNSAGVSLKSAIDSVPAGYSVSSLLVLDTGIGRVFTDWGVALNLIQDRRRPSNEADTSLHYLGYWTDAGAPYYYNFDQELGYAGTLLAEVQHLHSSNIPVHYLQLDSWWYEKDNLGPDGQPLKPRNPTSQNPRPVFPPDRWNTPGGTWSYEASPTLFPRGLGSFHQQLGMPLIAHARYIGQDSPYRETYRIAGIAPIDPRYWRHIAAYLKNNGVATYEQDWLGYIRQYSNFDADPRVADKFFDNMAAAMKAQGLTMQYCSAEPSMFLQGTRYSNLTTIRVSTDRFVRARWHDFLFTSQLAGSLGIWPWADNATSQDVNAILLQTLSAGPVGFADRMGQESQQNLMRAARADGVLVKPDAPLVPVDTDYIDGARGRHAPVLGYTQSKQGGVTTAYVFAFAPTPQDQGQVQFQANDVGLSGPMAVYDYFAHRLAFVPAGDSFRGELESDQASYYVLASPGNSGIAFLGDQDNFVGAGRMRIAGITDTSRQLTVNVVFARSENEVTLHGYAQFEPKTRVRSGQTRGMHYDSSTGEFNVTISPDPKASLVSQNNWGPRIRNVTVIFSRP
jgi:hypothetical protein